MPDIMNFHSVPSFIVTLEEIQKFIEYKPTSKSELLADEEELIDEREQTQYDIASVIKIQKLIRGYLTRKRYFYHSQLLWDTIFSKVFKHKERMINLRVLQQIIKKEKAEKPTSDTPAVIIYGNDLTVKIEFDSIPFPGRALSPKRVTLQRLQDMLDIDIYSHTLELHPEYVVQPTSANLNRSSPDESTNLEPNLKKKNTLVIFNN